MGHKQLTTTTTRKKTLFRLRSGVDTEKLIAATTPKKICFLPPDSQR